MPTGSSYNELFTGKVETLNEMIPYTETVGQFGLVVG